MKIFLSSTFTDLKDDRNVAINMLQDLIGPKKNIATGEIVAMEFFNAEACYPTEKCLAEVLNSDLVIGLYGERYGSIDQYSGLSITEMEFDTAVQNRIPVLAFIKNVDNRDDEEASFIERKIKSSDRLAAYYSTKAELAEKVNQSLKNYLSSFDGFSYDSLWDVIKDTEEELKDNPFQMEVFLPGNEQDAIDIIYNGSQSMLDFRKSLFVEHNAIADYAYLADCYPDKCTAKERRRLAKNVKKNASTIRGNFEVLAFGMSNIPQRMMLVALFFELQYMRLRLMDEVWSESLRQDVLRVRDKYRNLLKASQYSD